MLLGSASAVHADDLTASDAPSAMTIAPAMYGVFSRVPENWSDLPVQLKFSESVGYNSNILGIPTNGAALGFGRPVGTLEFDLELWRLDKSLLGGSAILRRRLDPVVPIFGHRRFELAGKLLRYRRQLDIRLEVLRPIDRLGTYLALATRPAGRIQRKKQRDDDLSQRDGHVSRISEYSWVLNSGVTSTTNTAALDKFNDSQSEFIAAGITYTVPQTNTLALLYTVTGTNYTFRPITLSTQGLLSNMTEDQLNLTYELLAERPERGGFFLGRAGRTRLRQVRRGRSCS